MGAFDWLSQSLDWMKNRWTTDWADFKKTFKESWTGLPEQMRGVNAGLSGMATAPFKDDGDFWGSARLWIDSVVGVGSGLAGGTIGTVFQVPVLHEAAWLLDKAYRYGFARPVSTSWTFMANNSREAYLQGSNPVTELAENLTEWNAIRQAWNDSEKITPGQAIVYYGNMSLRGVGDYDKMMRWAEAHDPKTPAGQATYNSQNADFWLKYGSGSLDFVGNALADPAHGAAAATKFAKLRLVDKVADRRYIVAGKVTDEPGTSAYTKVYDLARREDVTKEEFRDLTMPDAAFGGQIADLLWSAARMGPDVYRDMYLTIRAGDRDAYARLGESLPFLAVDFANLFVGFTPADMDFQWGQISGAKSADALKKAKAAAVVDAFWAGDSLWGQSIGLGVGEKMPRARTVSKLRAGYHSYILHSAPVIVGRPLGNLMPGQGHTPIIFSADSTGIGLKQFKANLERANTAGRPLDALVDNRDLILTPDEINTWTSRYGSAASDAQRFTVAMQVDNLVLTKVLERYGLSKAELPAVLTEVNKWRAGTRRLFEQDRLFISKAAQERALVHAREGRADLAAELLKVSEHYRKESEAGRLPDAHVMAEDTLGRLKLLPIDPTLPHLQSQFASVITMPDYRQLNAALRWWKVTHPKPKRLPDPDDPSKTIEAAALTPWEAGFAKLAKARGFYDWTISRLDTLSSIWKATALGRPAQAPRNVASDWALMLAHFGKLPLLTSSANIIPNAIRNFGPRGTLLVEMMGDWWAKARGMRKPRPTAKVDVEVDVPGNVSDVPPDKPKTYLSFTAMFADGQMPLQEYLNTLDRIFEGTIEVHTKKPSHLDPTAPRAAKRDRPATPELFKPMASRQVIGEQTEQGREARGLSGNRPERIDPNAIPGATAGPEKGAPQPVPPRLPRQPGDAPEMESFAIPNQTGRTYSPEGWSAKRIEIAPHDKELPERLRQPGDPGGGFGPGRPPGRSTRPQSPLDAAPYTPWRVGQPYFAENYWWRQYRDENINYEQYRYHIINEAFAAAGKERAYRRPTWGQKIVKQLITSHIYRRELPGYKDNPYAPGTLIVDPFTGMQPEIGMQNLRDNFDITSLGVLETRNVPKKKKGEVRSVALTDVHKQLTRWIEGNIDKLLIPDTQLALRVKPDGNIGVGLATAKKHVVEAGETLKANTAYRRLKNFRYDGNIADGAHTGIEFKDGKGNVIARLKGWAEGPEGQSMQRLVSARDNPTTAFGALVDDIDVENMVEEMGTWRGIHNHEANYPATWERTVNAQYASEKVMRLLLTRKADGTYRTVADAVTEIEDTAWGQKWIRDLSFRGVDFYTQVFEIEGTLNTLLPHPMDVGDELASAAIALREAALQKKATFPMFEKLFVDDDGLPTRSHMPEVHGQAVQELLGPGRTWKLMRGFIRKYQRIISDMPVDKWARFPFMALAYQKHGGLLVRVANEYFKDGPLPAKVVDRIQDMAREKAYHDVRYRLFDTAQRNDAANATRLLMPFSSAMMDSYIKYGRVIRENPMLLVQGAYYWDMFERNGMVQDEEGNVLYKEDGEDRFYRVDPTTGERTLVSADKVGKHRYIQFQLPSALSKLVGQQYYGVDANPVVAINKDTMNVFLNAPSGGPLVAFPANEFALNNPEFGEDRLVRKYLLPFGPSSNRGRVALPSTVRTAWEAFLAEDGDMAQGHAAAIMQAELIGYGLGTRNTPPTFEEVREKAAAMKTLRFMATFVSPASFQLKSPYQPYVDAYRQLLADPATADKAPEEFMRRHGDEFYAVTMSVTRNNTGLSASLESSQAYDKYKTLIQRYPEFGGLIVGEEGAGTFAKSVYESQKETPIRPGDTRTMRQLLSLRDSVEDLDRKTKWADYSKMMDLIRSAMQDRHLTSYKSRAALDLVTTRDAFVEANKYWVDPGSGQKMLSPWYLDFKSQSTGEFEAKLEAFRAIAGDEKLQHRDDIRGLLQYMQMREEMQQEMAYWQVKSLDNKKAAGLLNKWDTQVNDLVESNTAFAALWNRWLSNDEKLDIPSVTLGIPYGTTPGTSYGF